jgi:hypothetical protein
MRVAKHTSIVTDNLMSVPDKLLDKIRFRIATGLKSHLWEAVSMMEMNPEKKKTPVLTQRIRGL